MIKKTVTYTDYNGTERTEDFYFHLNKAELAEMQWSVSGGLEQRVRKIIATKDVPELIKIFKELVLKSYGEKSEDGRRFIKSEQIATEFSQTEAYSIIFMELAQNAEEAAKFVNGIIPSNLGAEANNVNLQK